MAFPPITAALRLSSASFLEGVLADADGTPAYSLFTTRGVTTLSRVGQSLSRTQITQITWPREARDRERAKEAGETVVTTSNGKMLMDDVLRPSGSGRTRKMYVSGSTVPLRWRFESGTWQCTTPSRALVATLKLVPGHPGTTLFIHTTSLPGSPNPYRHAGYDSDTSESSPNPHAAQALFDSLVLAAVLLCTHPDAWRARLAAQRSERPLPSPPVRASPVPSAYERTIGKSSRPSSSSSSGSVSAYPWS
ncbi:hypothetical protein RhiJN_07111 [Ceratobasidium sp. AG-Ba]|nr:hypothetical protein RhiJN_07111 [Ceratobasidium sp. AG-Ba]QRW07988.1 hypothetical protein RhiLY_06987 [Ceratobasidium sp. AG-Ba]